MALQINTNIGALMASAATSRAMSSMETSMERLSSGQRINTAADDAAGVAIASRMEAQIRGLNQAMRNAAEMALFEIADDSFALSVHDTRSTPEGAAAGKVGGHQVATKAPSHGATRPARSAIIHVATEARQSGPRGVHTTASVVRRPATAIRARKKVCRLILGNAEH